MIDRRTDSILRLGEVRARTGLSTATIYRREGAGTFPNRIRLGAKMVGWYASDIGEWIADPFGYRNPARVVSDD
ncbi:AlpA family phage regulatory protein [Sphingomonas sp. AP4-R1]|uniref:helix-turn-helix transcriptional regulator n=1 Tax=Sphingomonas sp. AP4-R1 TaxID=2735134 RepID=UPI0014938F62|nr:AlpA family phage regulatory protein [Sphingomonas sp. AP4-R1]QJU56826.1 AlpA family phage regulatory protein [Sphingomonas sp. AP4-R1]